MLDRQSGAQGQVVGARRAWFRGSIQFALQAAKGLQGLFVIVI
jgi:hypothetical protein